MRHIVKSVAAIYFFHRYFKTFCDDLTHDDDDKKKCFYDPTENALKTGKRKRGRCRRRRYLKQPLFPTVRWKEKREKGYFLSCFFVGQHSKGCNLFGGPTKAQKIKGRRDKYAVAGERQRLAPPFHSPDTPFFLSATSFKKSFLSEREA